MGHDDQVTDLRSRLADARLYLCTSGRRAQGDLPEFLDAVLGNGVDIVQLREKGLEAGEELALLDRKSTRLNSSHYSRSRMPSSA